MNAPFRCVSFFLQTPTKHGLSAEKTRGRRKRNSAAVQTKLGDCADKTQNIIEICRNINGIFKNINGICKNISDILSSVRAVAGFFLRSS